MTTTCTCGRIDLNEPNWALLGDGIAHYFDGTPCHYEEPLVEVKESELDALRELAFAALTTNHVYSVDGGDSQACRICRALGKLDGADVLKV